MKGCLFFLSAFLVVCTVRAEDFRGKPPDRPDITTTSGITYKRCEINRVDSGKISFFHSKGVARIPLNELSEETRKRLNLLQNDNDAEKQKIPTGKTEQTEIEKLLEELPEYRVTGRVVQILPDGVLLRGAAVPKAPFDEKTQSLLSKGREIERRINKIPKDSGSEEDLKLLMRYKGELEIVIRQLAEHRDWKKHPQANHIISGITTPLVDEDIWRGNVFLAGHAQYLSVAGAVKTVRRFAATKEEWKRIQRESAEREQHDERSE